jgi:hypothetical protein
VGFGVILLFNTFLPPKKARYNIPMKHIFATVIVVLSTFIAPSQSAQTCEPQPDTWFIEIFNISSMLLPENVSIELSPRDSSTGYLLIQNNSEIPLYVLPQDARTAILVTAEPEIAEDGLAAENIPQEILLVDLAPELAAFVITQGTPLQLGVENLPGLVPYIETRNISDFRRPSLVYLPVTQRGEFHLIYNDQLFTVQFSISYALNENFNPENCGEEREALTDQEFDIVDGQDNLIGSSIAFFLISLLTFGGLLFFHEKSKSREA